MNGVKRRILLADPMEKFTEAIAKTSESDAYEIATAHTGPEALEKIASFHPELIICDMMMPHVHGIEILKHVRENEATRNIGVIITSYHVLIQNYHSAIEEGADYFLLKPFEAKEAFELAERFFKKELTPAPFDVKTGYHIDENACYCPPHRASSSYLRFWGTRGSNPVAGADYIRYGGNTCCLEVRHNKTMVIIDAGSGIRQLGDIIAQNDHEQINLFIGHTHWDHMIGFPVFAPLYHKQDDIVVWAPVGFEKSTKELFTNMLTYSYFPVRLDEVRSKVSFNELRDGEPHVVGDLSIECHYTNHPGPTFCFKIRAPHKTVGYVTDNEMLMGYHGHPGEITPDHPLLEPYLSLINFLSDCDILIHEAQYFANEYAQKEGWGHSSMANATALVKLTGIPEWIITHHDPRHTDTDLQKKLQIHHDILHDLDMNIQVRMAYDGLMIPL